MTAKEKQTAIIKTCFKPLFKANGYLTKGQTWWRDQGDFFIIINLQNFSFNTKNDVTFCFNIGIALKALMKNPEGRRPNYYDLTVQIRDGGYLSDSRKLSPHKNNSGYIISAKTKVDDFIKECKADFEEDIFPRLDKMKTVKDCNNHYEKFSFWGEQLKRIIEGHGLSHLP